MADSDGPIAARTRRGRTAVWLVLLLVGIVLAVATASLADPFGRDALRGVVAACEMSKRAIGINFPCSEVNLGSPTSDGYVTIHSPGFVSEYLLAPLADYDGIESPELQADAATDLWRAAWAMRSDVAAALGRALPRTDLALAVNASGTRTQDHFHIHLDCLRSYIGADLAGLKGQITDRWARLSKTLRGTYYWARSLKSTDLAGINVPRLVADSPPALQFVRRSDRRADGDPVAECVLDHAERQRDRRAEQRQVDPLDHIAHDRYAEHEVLQRARQQPERHEHEADAQEQPPMMPLHLER